jgi:putative transposase
MPTILARKSVKQRFQPTPVLLELMEDFRRMTNDFIRLGLENSAQTMKQLSFLAYRDLSDRYGNVPSYYRLCAISKAAGILSSRRKSIKRGFPTKRPYVSKPFLLSCYGFKIKDGSLFLPLGERRFQEVPLNAHTLDMLSSQSGIHVRSFTITGRSLSLCLARAVEVTQRVESTVGIDRNLRNVTVGNEARVTYYDVSKAVEIGENTRSVIRSFKRNDIRIRKKLAMKYGQRRQERIRQILHRVSSDIVGNVKRNRQGIVFEDIKGIRKLYRKGNGQGRNFRGRMNLWPFGELKRQVEYKAAWEGVPVITLSRGETRGTTMDCVRCGERLQEPVRGDSAHNRQLWCQKCERWADRDLVAVLNISRRGWVRFAHSQEGKGEVGEAVKGNPEGRRQQVILRVDASKPSHQTKT